MHLIVHLIAGILGAKILSFSHWHFIIFVLASVLIDLDHFLEWKNVARVMKKKYLFNLEKYRKEVNYSGLQKSLHIFHTFEIIAIILIIGIYIPIFLTIGIAFSLHIMLDIIGNIWNRNFRKIGKEGWLKYWLLTYYIIKRDVWNRENL